MDEKELLIHAVLNEVERDLHDGYYEAVDELLGQLIEIDEAKEKLIGYLGDDEKERWLEGKTNVRY